MIVVVHTHFVPKAYLDAVEREPGAWGARLRRDEQGRPWIMPDNYPLPLGMGPIGDHWCVTADKAAAVEAQGVDVACISSPTFMFAYSADPERALKIARLQNDGLAATVKERPDRFVGMATVPMQDTRAAVAELERAVGTLGLRGVEIGTSVDGRDLDDPAFFPFFEAAHSPVALAYLVELVGPGQVMVGTDHPFDMGEPHPGRDVQALPGLSDANKARILSGNAAEWFGIPVQAGS